MADQKTNEEQLRLLMDAVAESIAQMPDEAVLSEYADEAAPKTRDILRAAIKRQAQAKLRAAKEQYQHERESLLYKTYALPKEPSDRRSLLSAILAAKPDLRQMALTVQHREFKDMTDADVESFLKQLDELGILDAFRKGGK